MIEQITYYSLIGEFPTIQSKIEVTQMQGEYDPNFAFANDWYVVFEFFKISQMYALIGGEYDHYSPKSSMILAFSNVDYFLIISK